METTQDLLSIPRRPLDVEDYVDILRRHKSWMAGPAFAALVLSVVVAFLWPDTYQSEATVQVIAPQVPERFVPSNVNSEMSQRINQMAQTVQSRANLINIIQSNGLYKSLLQRKPLEDVIEEMRSDIRISQVENLQLSNKAQYSAFRIAFQYSNRNLAQKVTQELVRGFIDENLRTLSGQSTATTEFLKDEWESAKKTLDDLENRLTQFRLQNSGRLPEQLQSNLTTLRTLEQQLSGINEAINRIGQEKLLLESQIHIYRDQLQTLTQGGDQPLTVAAKNQRLVELEHEIVTQETNVSSLKERYKETHPDVKAAEAQLDMLRGRRDAFLKEEDDKKSDPAPPKKNTSQIKGVPQLEAQIAGLLSQIQARNLELDERNKAQKQLVTMITQYNERIQSSPIMERTYNELTRDYALAKARYDELNEKKSQSEIATSLENRGQGERLQLLDPASLPETPVQPKRLAIVGSGAAIGLLIGIFIGAAREMKDTSIKNLKDARAYTNLSVLGTVPLLENDLVVRRKRRLVWAAWVASCMGGMALMALSMYYYYAVTRGA
ncbi:MAG TPA: Wzz/FepE/Etk N-terminal domain-containing protein [Bryobacteraceae bacterium]|nr:Wzz/FepE/Etk N-terminal domain-containing protein [Bryobacteraceae bacterium]